MQKVKVAQNDPLDQVDSEIKDVGVVLHVQEEVYQSTLTFRRRAEFCPEPNLIKDKIPVLGLDIVERQV